MKWKILDTGVASAEKNMALDYALLRDLESMQQPILHLYGWEAPCATYGHFLDPYEYLNKNEVESYSIQLARRPTGGGVLFHLTDFAFSVLVPATHPEYSVNTLENYAFVNRMIVDMLHQFLGKSASLTLLEKEPATVSTNSNHFCMAKPIVNDVMIDGKKISGGAQRRTKHGFLHQGTISLALPEETVIRRLLKDPSILDDMHRNTFIFPEKAKDLKQCFQEFFGAFNFEC